MAKDPKGRKRFLLGKKEKFRDERLDTIKKPKLSEEKPFDFERGYEDIPGGNTLTTHESSESSHAVLGERHELHDETQLGGAASLIKSESGFESMSSKSGSYKEHLKKVKSTYRKFRKTR